LLIGQISNEKKTFLRVENVFVFVGCLPGNIVCDKTEQLKLIPGPADAWRNVYRKRQDRQ
jgi:hypothetical protein